MPVSVPCRRLSGSSDDIGIVASEFSTIAIASIPVFPNAAVRLTSRLFTAWVSGTSPGFTFGCL